VNHNSLRSSTIEHTFDIRGNYLSHDQARSGVPEQDDCSTEELIEGMDAVHAGICAGQRELFRFIAHADFIGAWWDCGARDLAHWLSMRYGISHWKANRWIAAAHALEGLALISQAFSSGELSIDKVVELTRFATPETEARLIAWAQRVSCAAIRRRGDLAARHSIEDTRDARADALVALASARLASDADADRVTVVVHAQLEGLLWGTWDASWKMVR